MPKVYISPSSQYANEGLAPFTTEGAEMNIIASALMQFLVFDGRFTAKCSTPDMTDVYEKARDSNEYTGEFVSIKAMITVIISRLYQGTRIYT